MTATSSPATELIRVATAGSVDDGKSTLIGRLLFETGQIMEDQLAHVEEVSLGRGDGYVNLALLTDGLRAEREQGITIDVAYRYFQTPKRKFVLADTPGHEQYTRNMVTGASTANVALILVDARNGVVEQSRRHALIASLLRIPHVVVCVNKMDLVGFDEAAVDAVRAELARRRGDPDVGARGRQRGGALGADALVRRALAARVARGPAGGGRQQPRRPALPRAVGDQAELRRAPRLPRLRRADGGRGGQARATR